jgi:hypothetical protein
LRAVRNIIATALVSALFACYLIGQVNVDGDWINQYTSVRTVYHGNESDADSVAVINPELFHPGDTCLFHVTKGAEIYNPPDIPQYPVLWGKVMNINNTGIYAFLIVDLVQDSLVIFTAPLPPMIYSSKSEAVQLVRISTADKLVINRPLECTDWDPITGTGGIMALIAHHSITINATINATGTGFSGGQPGPEPFGDSCKTVTDGAYQAGAADSAGNKGESIVHNILPWSRGKSSNGTGGGGGNGKYSGGGGGSNYGLGSTGGMESESCSPGQNQGGRANYLNPAYFANSGEFKNRIFMGGGGGTSTQDLPSRVATAGGNGGGIIILLTDSVICPGNDTIRAGGQTVTDTATAGAGGGGGGGMIIIDADHYSGHLHLMVNGGDGGHTNDPQDVTGPGGFGGAGLLWFAGESLPAGVTVDTTAGHAGIYTPDGTHHGAITTQGHSGDLMTGLVSPLQGFLFNNISAIHNLCSDETDISLWGSHPKGGEGSYSCKWEISADQSAWNQAPGTADQKDYLTAPADTGKYFRRIVTSGSLSDTSKALLFRHYPSITNNAITGGGIICTNETADPVLHSGSPLTGGTGAYNYLWQQFTLPAGWNIATGTGNAPDYSPGYLSDTCLFRRIVISGECLDTSNTVRFDVRQPLTVTRHPQDVSVYPGEPAEFSIAATGTPPITCQWYLNDHPVTGADEGILTISRVSNSDTGDYYCVLSNICGDISSSVARLTIIPTAVGMYEQTGSGIRVFPNPVKDVVYVEYARDGIFEVELYDVLGNRKGWWRQPGVINVADLVPGMYLLRFVDEKERAVVIRIDKNKQR